MAHKDISETHDALVHDAGKLKKNVQQIAEDVKEHATAHVHFVQDKAKDTLDQISDYVRENPVYVVGGAFVLGLLIGYTRRK